MIPRRSRPADVLAPVRGHVFEPLRARLRGNRSHRLVRSIDAFLSLPREEMRAQGLARLKALLVHARDTVPFHAYRMRAAGFDPEGLASHADLSGLPSLTRRDVAEHARDLLSTRFDPERLAVFRSGGTTASPVPFRQAQEAIDRKDAAALALRRRMGWLAGDRAAFLWGAAHDSPHGAGGRLKEAAHAFDRLLSGALFLPAGDLSDGTMDGHAARLRRFRPAVLQGYPTATDVLARRVVERGLALDIPLVVLTAEPTMPAQRERIARALSADVFTFYGAREVGWIAAECVAERRLHVNTAGVHVEADSDGRLLVTDLENFAMPLLRYVIGDRGALDDRPCPCGDPRPVIDRLEGREADVIPLPSGRRVPGLLLDVRGLQWETPGILEAQFVQTAPDALDIRWVRAPNFSTGDLEHFAEYVEDVLHHEMHLAFHETDRILPGPNGKVRHVLALSGGPDAGASGASRKPRARSAPLATPARKSPRGTRPRDPLTPLWSLIVKPAAARFRDDHAFGYAHAVERLLSLPVPAARRWRLARLKALLTHAKGTVPFYRDRMNAAGFEPHDLVRVEDLAVLPSLSRHDLAARPEELLSSAFAREGLVEARSGGTTSQPVPFLQPRSAVAVKDAAALVLRRRMGWEPGHRAAYLWGAAQDLPPAPSGLPRRAKAWATGRFVDRSLLLPAGDLSDARLDEVADALSRYRPTALQAYPSAADLLARRLVVGGRRLSVPIVLLTAEPVWPEQRERVASALTAEVFTFYGARECGWIASECAAEHRLHVNTACVHLEVAEDGRLLVTDLVNRAMPLIRYDIGDRGSLDPDPCPCGDPRPVLSGLEGRVNDVFVLPSGRRVPGVVADLRAYRIGLGILEAQLVQDEPAALDVNWVAGPNHRPGDEDVMAERLVRMFFGELSIRLHRVDRLEVSPNGKVRYCVSRVGVPSP